MTKKTIRAQINCATLMDESKCLKQLLQAATLQENTLQSVQARARDLIEKMRQSQSQHPGVETFLNHYKLTTLEGIALMCLSEALLRIPDKATIDELIADKLGPANWQEHLGASDSFFVNATTWALMLTGKVLTPNPESLTSSLSGMIGRVGEPVIRKAISTAMKIMGQQFIMGRSIEEARKSEQKNYKYSYDMLGEAARTAADAERYYQAYCHAIDAAGDGISVKLSALHPRYHIWCRERVLKEMVPKVLALAQRACCQNKQLIIDAEESERLDLSLDIFEAVFLDSSLQGYEQLGLALQSYQKRAFFVIDWLVALSQEAGRKIPVRLIKGAYWDTEIKRAQMQGLDSYPVFTRKSATDVSFQACALKLKAHTDTIHPMFATHNAYSVALIQTIMADAAHDSYEFQCLYGMGQALYADIPARIYAPVGSHEDLLPYLVRRLLENGANTSFVNLIQDAPIENLIKDPLEEIRVVDGQGHPNIPLPKAIFLPRKNAKGMDLTDTAVIDTLTKLDYQHEAVTDIDSEQLDTCIAYACSRQSQWAETPVSERAAILRQSADLLEDKYYELMHCIVYEAKKTWSDALAEVREAVDFCRYYADRAEADMQPLHLSGYTGETNVLTMHPRGVMLCVSPWNFPLAIFLGQVSACLATGNSVIAKPAEQTPKIARKACQILWAAGVPDHALQLAPGQGEVIGAQAVNDKRIQGVLFTGSTDTARVIARGLAHRDGPIVPLIAETGGQNAMIVDSSALIEQVVQDSIESAFGSCGQRCSALRILCVQADIADKVVEMLTGAMAELTVGDSQYFKTDIGPVIDADAKAMVDAHIERMDKEATRLAKVAIPDNSQETFVTPAAYLIQSLKQIPKEVFGPVLHVLTYEKADLNKIIDAINATGYGLTFGVHSRINNNIEAITKRIHAGNCYVNRNTIGAIVGLQPFGGEGLSGTGPKAGGPHYLYRLVTERTQTTNTTAAGGNTTLLMMD